MSDHVQRHGLSIGIERINSRFFLTLKVIGKLTHEDYGTITPMIESALEGVKTPKIRANQTQEIGLGLSGTIPGTIKTAA